MIRPLRIMHVVRSDRFAGVEQFVLRLAVAQAEAGHRVHVAGGASTAMRPALAAAGATWERLHRVHSLAVVLRRHGVGADVVNTHMTDADVAAAALLPVRGPALVSTRHFARPRRRIGHLRIDPLLGRIDAEVSISSAVASAIGVPSTVVHTGVPLPSALADGSGRQVVMVQRLQPEKRTDIGIRAFVVSGLSERGWTLRIAGDGPLRGVLQRQIDVAGAARSVQLLGFRDDVPALLASASLILAPCPVEGLGLATLEAMATGLAPVVADAAGHRDIVDGLDPAARFTPNDPDAAAAALVSLATDDRRRDALAHAARDRVREHFSLERQRERTDAVYRNAIARRSR